MCGPPEGFEGRSGPRGRAVAVGVEPLTVPWGGVRGFTFSVYNARLIFLASNVTI